MRYLFFIFLWIYVADLCSQPLAPRNRNHRRPVLESYGGGGCSFCVLSDSILKGQLNLGCPVTYISYHAGHFANPLDSLSPDLRTPCGTQLHDLFKINQYPTAYINRDIGPLFYTEWYKLFDFANEFTEVSVGMETKYDTATRKVSIEVEMYPFYDFKDSILTLSVFLIENNVTAPQVIYQGKIDTFYKHPFVFRDNISDCTGDQIDDVKLEVPINKFYNCTLPLYVKSKDAYIVAFVTDQSGVIITSDQMPATGGRTQYEGYLKGEESVEVLLGKNEFHQEDLIFVSYNHVATKYCFDLNIMGPNDDIEMDVAGTKSKVRVTKTLNYLESVNIKINIGPIRQLAYNEIYFEVLPNCEQNKCGVVYTKEIKVYPNTDQYIVYNTSMNRNGDPRIKPFWSPLDSIFSLLECSNRMVISDTDFVRVSDYYFRTNKKVSSIYYCGGWGHPLWPLEMKSIVEEYITKGTNFFISGQDVAYLLGSSRIANNNSNIEWITRFLQFNMGKEGDSSYSNFKVIFNDPIFGAIRTSSILLPYYADDRSSNINPDVIFSIHNSTIPFLTNNHNFHCGIYKQLGNAKFVLISTGLETFANKDFAVSLLKRTIEWFGECNLTGEAYVVPNAGKEISLKRISGNNYMLISCDELDIKYHVDVFSADGRLEYSQRIVAGREIEMKVANGLKFYRVYDLKNKLVGSGYYLFL
ncbi:MAG TPA: Omp28-related outer membrane protein [Saprospiraceae bacterium]|nr:Omp28-related outer membrane protein [Saprospiraceae bacterium]